MHAPNPDPTGRPSSAKQPAAAPSDAATGSTGSHREPTSEPALSELIQGTSSAARRSPNADDLAAHLAAGPSNDDAPTVITQPGKTASVPPPPPPHVVGEAPSIAGRRLGHFELIEAIGAGGMAAVLKARDLDLGRIVALKILPPASAQDVENVTRFKQEARAAAKLDHDNVARVYFCGEDQGLHFIAFEFVEGITLRQMIDRTGTLSAGDCVRLMIQVAAGLAHAAERGVVHRDIKPSNILITPDCRAKIVDMGLARHLDAGSVNGGVTQSGVTLGTFDYISPEQALDPRQADVRSDIYSLGCAFYHALTGQPPVPEGTAAKKLHAHQYVDPLDPRDLNGAIPDELAAVLAHMMAKDPTRRYQTPAELIAHLKALAQRLRLSLDAVAADATVQAVAADDRMLPRLPRLRLSWVAAGAAIVAAAVAISVAANGPERSPQTPLWATGPGPGKPEATPNAPNHDPKAPAPDGELVDSAEGLAKALANPETTKVRLAPVAFDLTNLPKPVAFQGPKLELIGSGSATIRVNAPTGKRADAPAPGTLTIHAGAVTVQGIRFEIASPAGAEPSDAEAAGLTILDAAKVEVRDCLFVPDRAARDAGVAALAIAKPAGDSPARVKLERCLFAPGAIGLSLARQTEVAIDDSGFAPHATAILVRSDMGDPEPMMAAAGPTPIRLDRSSFMLDAGCVGVAAESADLDVRVSAGYCVFARAGGPATTKLGAVIRTAGVKLAAARDRKNAYYGVELPKALSTDESAWSPLERRPWDASGDVLAAFATPEPWSAFRLTLTGPGADRAIFLTQDGLGVIGAQFHAQDNLRRAYIGANVTWPPAAPELKTRVWWPNGPADDKSGVQPNLVKLLQDVRSGDTILIRHNGLLPVPQHLIEPTLPGTGAERSDFHLTFKADKGYTPILTPAPSQFLDRSLFRVREGHVAFEGLHFLLKPGAEQEVLAAVTLIAGKGCSFQQCTFTLEEGEAQIASVVALTDPGKEMKMDGAVTKSVPKIEFDRCLIRGKGRAVSLPVSRPFALDMRQCITGLNGAVVFAKAGGRDPGSAAVSTIHLSRVTALLGGPLLELQGAKVNEMKASGLVQTSITADGCLFAAVPGAGQPMVEVGGTDLDPTDPNRVLKWTTGDPNRFANFDPATPVVIVRPGPDATNTQNWKWNEWIPFAKEVARPVGKVTFANEPDNLKDLANLKPGDVRVESVEFPGLEGPKPTDAGADPDKVANPPEETDPKAPV